MGQTDNRVTRCSIEDAIITEHYFTAGEALDIVGSPDAPDNPLCRLTFCVLVLDNGFTVTGESSCVDPANFVAETGMRVAREKAIEKIWPLLGFRLRDRMHDEERKGSDEEQLRLCLENGGAV